MLEYNYYYYYQNCFAKQFILIRLILRLKYVLKSSTTLSIREQLIKEDCVCIRTTCLLIVDTVLWTLPR